MTPDAKAEERKQLNLEPVSNAATKIQPGVKFGVLGVFVVVLLAIVFGVLTHTGPKGKKGKAGDNAAVVQPDVASTAKSVDELQNLALRQQAAGGGAAGTGADGLSVGGAKGTGVGPNGSSIPKGDVANELNLPPTRIVQGGVTQPRAGAYQGPRQPSAAELAAINDAEEERAARTSSLTNKGGSQTKGLMGALGGGLGGAGGGALEDRLAALAAAGQVAKAGGGPTEADDQNKQGDKAAFLAAAHRTETDNTQIVSRQKAFGPYVISAGWDIPATLEQRMNSDLPGDVRGIVRENVYDSATGRHLLIPQGSRVVGSYNSHVAYGQSGLQVVWTRLIYPDGSSIELGGLNGQDVAGISGFRDKVDNHYARLLGFALLTSGFAAGIQLSQGTSQPVSELSITPMQAASQAVSQQVGQLGEEITRKNLNIQPTIKISIGYRFTIRVRKDLVFERPYGG